MRHFLKRFSFSVIAVVASLGLATPVLAEQIKSFDVKITLDTDRKATITESITYDFGAENHHGIFRVIPDVYDRSGARYRLRFDVDSIKMDGQDVPWKIDWQTGALNLKIGDEDKTVRGSHVYTIIYSTKKAINTIGQAQEFYWNVTGNDWQIPIQQASVSLVGPTSTTKQVCYVGIFGSDVQDCHLSATDQTVTAKTNKPLKAGEGLTLVLEYPATTFVELSWQDRVMDFVQDNLALFLPIVVALIMYILWSIMGRDPRGRGTIIPQYDEPSSLRPAEMSALIEQHVSQPAITATILDLARRGYLKIRFTGEQSKSWFKKKPNFTLVKLKDSDGACKPFEREILDALFVDEEEVHPNDVEDFWKAVQTMRAQVFDGFKSKQLMLKNPAIVRATWITIAVIMGFSGIFMVVYLGNLMLVSTVISGLIIFAFGWFMPKMTRAGAILLEEVKGFKLFLGVAEGARLSFHNAPAKTPEMFERFLPAAVAFGVEEQWAEQFKGMQIDEPSYVEGNTAGWSAAQYASLSHDLHEASASGMYSAPSSAGSGGSGFSGGGSGGGFGGGGGGSW